MSTHDDDIKIHSKNLIMDQIWRLVRDVLPEDILEIPVDIENRLLEMETRLENVLRITPTA